MDEFSRNTSLIPNGIQLVPQGNIEAYIRFVNSIPLLTDKEEYDLAERWREQEDVEAARYLVLSHLRLVVSISRTYLGYGLPLSDIIQEGTIGLMKAVKRFDARRNVRLVTFAIYWIKAEINEFVIKNWRIVKTVTTKSQRKLFFKLRSKRQDIGNLSDIEAESISQELKVSKADVVDMNMRLTANDISLLPETGETFGPIDWLRDEERTPEKLIERKMQDKLQTDGIEMALAQLDERSREIIRVRWLADPENQPTLQELANKFGVSAERIRQIEVKAMQKMKDFLETYN